MQAKANILERIGLTILHFDSAERAAQAKALAITTNVKNLLGSPEALTIEEVFPEAATAAPVVTALVNKLITVLENPVIANDLDEVAATLGRYGAKLTQAFHGNVHPTLNDYIIIFESLFNAKPLPAATTATNAAAKKL